ncbi:MAG: hypothetical protein ACJ71Y_20915 [Blastococcus sp.]|jgi:hypothetical protein
MVGEALFGNSLKALDTDLCLTSAAVAVAFALAVATRWARELGFLARALMVGVAGFAATIALFTGNLSWAFYVEHADPFLSVAHPVVRLIYLAGGSLFADVTLAVPLTGSFVYRGDPPARLVVVYARLLASLVLLNLLLVLALLWIDARGPL